MKCAADFRRIARNALKGKWGIAVIVTVVAVFLGARGNGAPELDFNIEGSNVSFNFDILGMTIYSTSGGFESGIGGLFTGGAISVILAAASTAALHLLLGSVLGVGYSRFTMELLDRNNAGFKQLFQYFPYWKNTFCTRLLKEIYVFLWTLLFIVPGIMVSYSYAMTDFILADHPEMTAGEALAASKEMMEGNRWRLFCLHISFWGWMLLSMLTLGVGNLWLNPYKNVAIAEFYREVSGTENAL